MMTAIGTILATIRLRRSENSTMTPRAMRVLTGKRPNLGWIQPASTYVGD